MSTVVATKSAFVDVLSNRPALAAVQVSYGDVVRSPRKERVYFGDVEDHEAEPASMRAGKVRMEENYTLRLLVSVDHTGSQEAAEERAFTILGEVEDALASDPKMAAASTPPGILFATYGGSRCSTSIVAESTYRSLIEADIHVKARNA